jgi:hypothetical protein
MTKNIVWAFVITILALKGFSQENPLHFISEPKVPEDEIKKNEAGLNTAPFITMFLGAEMYHPKIALSYKRIIKSKNAIRASINSLSETYINSNYKNYYIISQTDSTQLRRNYENTNGNKYQVNIGYEWRKGKKKLKYFFGNDLIFGYAGEKHRTYDENYILQKTIIGKDTLNQFYLDSSITIEYSSTRYLYAGISPFIGLYYPLSKKFVLSIQTGADILFSIGRVRTKDYIKNETSEVRVSTFDLNMNGLINDLSLVYRF